MSRWAVAGGRAAGAVLRADLVPSDLRVRALRLLGAEIGAGTRIQPGCRVDRPSELTIGENVFVNVDFSFDGRARLEIGDAAAVGPHVRVITAQHAIGPSRARAGLSEAVGVPVTVGAGTWIGAGAMLLPGVQVAAGCVIAAGAVVSRSTEPDGLYAGVPARRIRDLPLGRALGGSAGALPEDGRRAGVGGRTSALRAVLRARGRAAGAAVGTGAEVLVGGARVAAEAEAGVRHERRSGFHSVVRESDVANLSEFWPITAPHQPVLAMCP